MIIACVKEEEQLLKKIMEGKKILKIKNWNGEFNTYNLKMLLDNDTIVTIKSYKSGLEIMDIEIEHGNSI